MATDRYRPSLRSRLTAAIFTDRPGQTLAAVIGFATILRWWIGERLGRSVGEDRGRADGL